VSSAIRIDDLMSRAKEASGRVVLVRLQAVAAIRLIERRLQEVLAGDTLRGLRDLTPSYGTETFAAAVAWVAGGALHPAHGVDTFPPIDGRELLVLDRAGALRVVAVGDGEVGVYPAEDVDFRVDHVEALHRAVITVLERHVERTERIAVGYGPARELADRLSALLPAT
jgi:hypothetical protein